MARRTALTFTELPAWTLQAAPGALSFFEAMALAGLEGQWVRLSAATQKALLGAVVFGKQELRVTAEGTVEIKRVTAFGLDSECGSYDLFQIKGAVSQHKRLSPGVTGPDFWSLGEQIIIDAIRVNGLDDQAKALASNNDYYGLARLVKGAMGESPNWVAMNGAARTLLAA